MTRYTCPACGFSREIADRFAGTGICCQGCGADVVVPAVSPPAAAAPTAFDFGGPEKPAPESPGDLVRRKAIASGWPTEMRVAAWCVILLCVGGAVALGWWVISGKPTPAQVSETTRPADPTEKPTGKPTARPKPAEEPKKDTDKADKPKDKNEKPPDTNPPDTRPPASLQKELLVLIDSQIENLRLQQQTMQQSKSRLIQQLFHTTAPVARDNLNNQIYRMEKQMSDIARSIGELLASRQKIIGGR